MQKNKILDNSKEGIKLLLRSFKYRNYSLFFTGQFFSLIGVWMQQIALSWLVYRLTNDALILGFTAFIGQLPTFLLSPFTGVFADKFNKHKIMIFTQIFAMMQATVLFLLVWMDRIEVWHIFVLASIAGLIHAIDAPVRHAFIPGIVEKKEDLQNAIALNSAMFNGARLVGPSIAGIIIASYGEEACFFINAITYIIVIAALLMMKFKKTEIKKRARTKMLYDLKEGFFYAFRFRPIRFILLHLVFLSLFAIPFNVLMPIFARDVLKGGAENLGFLMGAFGLGALLGAVILGMKKDNKGLWKNISISTFIFGLGITAFSLSRHLYISMALMFISGLGMMMQMTSCNTLLQTVVDDDKRGRVMSLYMMSFLGVMPFGALIIGVIAKIIGAPITIMIAGLITMVSAVFFYKKLIPIKEHSHRISKELMEMFD